MNSILYLREIGNNFHCINEYIIISFYIYEKARESSYLIEIIAEIHVVNILKSKILIAIDIVNTEKIFINFRIRTLAIDIILEFSANIRAIRKNIKMIKIVVNFCKKEIISLNIIKEIPIRMRKKLNDNCDFLFLFEYPNAICYIMNSNFSFIQIYNDGENPIRVSRRRLEFIKKFIKIEYHHVDPESHDFAISRIQNINSEPHFRSSIIKEHDILITHDINVYQDTRPQNLDDIVAKYSDL
jgi:hypothetical protein